MNLTVSLRGTAEVKENCQIFHLIGKLDAFSEPTFFRVVNNSLENGPVNLILDLSAIDFIDSSGLGALVRLAKAAKEANGTLQIVSNARVTQTVKLVRLEKFLSLGPSVDEALQNLQSK